MPNMPGSVTSFLAGRTYPNEGAAVMLPQHAPYTDPVTILICGGSNFGVALDNCVSIQPEATKPAWTIERMVSRPLSMFVMVIELMLLAAFPTRDAVYRGAARWHIPHRERGTSRCRRLWSCIRPEFQRPSIRPDAACGTAVLYIEQHDRRSSVSLRSNGTPRTLESCDPQSIAWLIVTPSC